MKLWLANLVIVSYLGAMGFGLFSNVMGYMNASHPAMYFVVWDMFCGWSAYENRIHLVGEGESGTYYDLSSGPWGEFTPYSDIGRRHYDYNGLNLKNISENVLAHTSHEPMARIYVFEENWAKKYNMPDYIWSRLYDEPKEPRSYFAIRQVLDSNSQIALSNACWLSRCSQNDFVNNPRLQREAQSASPYYTFDNASKRKPASRSTSRPKEEKTVFQDQKEPDNLFTPAGN
ncbi:hypothetical protein Pla110_33900 [Polystyrenella longa]|uniref:Uncharacterized protein n=1 Tax=Polystyrenella longa TaxID=2528007 RepID=A0A518CQY7_9PLAN|nr:hypothetical protein [Polystyrenella longa]QDU81646.1 hypothetical protein Pla110_33900 [Polystyrenella longa]